MLHKQAYLQGKRDIQVLLGLNTSIYKQASIGTVIRGFGRTVGGWFGRGAARSVGQAAATGVGQAAATGAGQAAATGATVGQRALGGLKRFGTGFKNFMIGDPKAMMQQYRQGGFKRLLAKGTVTQAPGLIRQSFPQGKLSKGLMYGLPAIEAAKVVGDDDPNKLRRLGGIAGGTALGLAAWRPLGMLGSMAAGSLGEAAGSGFLKKPPPKIAPQQQPQFRPTPYPRR
jgi:hypothetical protein